MDVAVIDAAGWWGEKWLVLPFQVPASEGWRKWRLFSGDRVFGRSRCKLSRLFHNCLFHVLQPFALCCSMVWNPLPTARGLAHDFVLHGVFVLLS